MRERERERERDRESGRERERQRERQREGERDRDGERMCVCVFLCSNTRLRTCTHGATYLRVRLALNTQIQPWACTANIGRNRAPTCYCDAEASDRR